MDEPQAPESWSSQPTPRDSRGVPPPHATVPPHSVPHSVPHAPAPTAPRPPLDDPEDLDRPAFDQLLRSPYALLARIDGPNGTAVLTWLAVIAIAGHAVYGLVVGSFSGGDQWWAAPTKIAIGAILCGAICFPSLYILVSQSGARTRARHVLGMLLTMSASTAVLLAGFAPVAWIFSQSSNTISWLAPLHYLVWFVSVLASKRVFEAGLRRWHARRGALVGLWLTVFVVTCLQMTTTLRPILGTAPRALDGERKFFLAHWGETIATEARAARRD